MPGGQLAPCSRGHWLFAGQPLVTGRSSLAASSPRPQAVRPSWRLPAGGGRPPRGPRVRSWDGSCWAWAPRVACWWGGSARLLALSSLFGRTSILRFRDFGGNKQGEGERSSAERCTPPASVRAFPHTHRERCRGGLLGWWGVPPFHGSVVPLGWAAGDCCATFNTRNEETYPTIYVYSHRYYRFANRK